MKATKASKKLYFFPILSMCITTLFYSNCQNQVEFEKQEITAKQVSSLGTPQSPAETEGQYVENIELTPTQIEKSCASAQLKSKVMKVNFPDPGRTCEFGANGNLEARNQYLQARIEQKAELSELPDSAIICDLDIEFEKQAFLYDDHFLMMFNGHVLAASINMENILPVSEGLLRYDWSYIAGSLWNNADEGIYCAGMGEGLSNCYWPQTDVNGEIRVDYDPKILYKIMAQSSKSQTSHNFQFVTIGDNDNRDCEHSEIDFDVRVTYYE